MVHRVCLILALVLCPALSLGRLLTKHDTVQPVDFPQYYLGGRMLATGHTEALYPIPTAGSPFNAGFVEGSTLRPAAAEEVARQGIREAPRFIQPPPSAMVFAAIGVLPVDTAAVCWVLLMALCQVGLGVLSAALCRRCNGSAILCNAVLLAVALGPAGLNAIGRGNLSPAMGMLLAANLLLLLRGRQLAAAPVFALGLVLKYWNAALIPVHLARRQLRTVWASAAIGAAWFAASLAIMGWDPYRVWLGEIVPTLARTATHLNHSSLGLLVRLHGGELGRSGTLAYESVRWCWFATVAVVTWRARRRIAGSDSAAIAAFGAWMASIELFSPVVWNHYVCLLMPTWGWLAKLTLESRGAVRIAAALALLSPAVVTPLFSDSLPDPWFAHSIVARVLVVALGVRELAGSGGARRRAAPERVSGLPPGQALETVDTGRQ